MSTPMEFATLGKTGLRASRIGIGCSHLASVGSSQPPREIEATLRAAADAGINFFDTASVYGQGDSERMLGRVFERQRDGLILCTKAGLRLSVSQKVIRLAKPLLRKIASRRGSVHRVGQAARQSTERQCFKPGFLTTELESSLRRLRTDRVDLFLLHSPPVSLAEEDSIPALLEKLVASGKARFVGVSCGTADEAAGWIEKWPRIDCLQIPFSVASNPFDRPDPGVGIVAREVLAGGAIFERPAPPDLDPAALAIRHVLEQPAVDVALVRASSREHLEANLAALNPLSDDQQLLAREWAGSTSG